MEDKIWGWQGQVQSRAPSTVLDLSSEANRAHKTTENMLKNAKDQNPPKNVGHLIQLVWVHHNFVHKF